MFSYLENSFMQLDFKNSYRMQKILLFLAIVLFPISFLFFSRSFISGFSFYGQLSSIPVFFGLLLFLLSCFSQKPRKIILILIATFSALYLFLVACISLHSMIEYAEVGSFDAASFGESPKILLLKNFLLALGISNTAVLYSCLIFVKDMLLGTKEIFSPSDSCFGLHSFI